MLFIIYLFQNILISTHVLLLICLLHIIIYIVCRVHQGIAVCCVPVDHDPHPHIPSVHHPANVPYDEVSGSSV